MLSDCVKCEKKFFVCFFKWKKIDFWRGHGPEDVSKSHYLKADPKAELFQFSLNPLIFKKKSRDCFNLSATTRYFKGQLIL